MDWTAKLALIVSKMDARSLRYAVEALYSQMRRKGQKGPYGAKELAEVISDIIWMKT